MTRHRHVTIFPYRFGKGSEEHSSYQAPEDSYPLLQETLSRNHLSCKLIEVVPEAHSFPSNDDEHGYKPGTIKNIRAVIETVTSLAEKSALTLLKEESLLLTFGGDHTQGLGALKGLILGETVKALLRRELPLKEDAYTRFEEAVLSGDMHMLTAYLNRLIDEGTLPISWLTRFLKAFHVLWFDAHGDYNTRETSPSGNAHGMAAAAITGVGDKALTDIIGPWAVIPPENMHFIAVRDLDPGEIMLMEQHKVDIHDMEAIQRLGLKTIVDTLFKEIEHLSQEEAGRPPIVHLSFDIDGMDAKYVPGTGTPVGEGSPRNHARGPSLHETLDAFRGIASRLTSLDIAEANYRLDRDPARITLKSVTAVVESFFATLADYSSTS